MPPRLEAEAVLIPQGLVGSFPIWWWLSAPQSTAVRPAIPGLELGICDLLGSFLFSHWLRTGPASAFRAHGSFISLDRGRNTPPGHRLLAR